MRQWLNVLALALLMTQSNSAPSLAEQKFSAGSVILIPGALGGVESHAPGGYWRLCSPQSVGLNEWRADYLEHLIKPTNSQLELFSRLQVASAAAKNAIASSCTKETVSTGPAHFAEMEKRLTGLLNLIRALRRPYETFYASLDSRKKAIVDGLGPGRRGWSW